MAHGQNNCSNTKHLLFTGLSGACLILTVVRVIVNKVSKTGLTWGHLKHLHINKEVLTRRHYGKTPDLYREVSILRCLSEVRIH